MIKPRRQYNRRETTTTTKAGKIKTKRPPKKVVVDQKLHFTKSQVIARLKNPFYPIWRDDDGRIYIKMTDTPEPSQGMFLYTVCIFQETPGAFGLYYDAKAKKTGANLSSRDNTVFQNTTDFPLESTTVTLFDYFKDNSDRQQRKRTIVIRSYPERITLSTKSTSVFCEEL